MDRRNQRQERRADRVAERLERIDAILATLESPADLGPVFQHIAAIEEGMGAPVAPPEAQALLGDLGIEPADLLPGAVRNLDGTLRLAMAIARELGKRIPLDLLLSAVPGLPSRVVERGLLLPVGIALASSYRSRTDPGAREQRIERLKRRRERLARRAEPSA